MHIIHGSVNAMLISSQKAIYHGKTSWFKTIYSHSPIDLKTPTKRFIASSFMVPTEAVIMWWNMATPGGTPWAVLRRPFTFLIHQKVSEKLKNKISSILKNFISKQ
ncbi:hypothetical protein Pyn_12963 [Prunus yedoensis var. nudiflora]|uniref:Uncharacterized protein n=1 Tax=Prunus yedoensis var. nudiflora TaxID=2094558 RepID=A0A314US67_PRUYE|nr:hypothetical protein Pyn_12963 [Prunus yedoensis var. nudiflora]